MRSYLWERLILLAIPFAFLSFPLMADDAVGSPADYDAILRKYVKGDYFQYGELKKNKDDLARFERFMRWQAHAEIAARQGYFFNGIEWVINWHF